MIVRKIFMAGLACVTTCDAFANTGDSTISANVFGQPLVIRTSSQFAGAIASLTWAGVEFINSTDHGRELQSAMTLNNLGECYNPTEAGSRADADTNASSSVISSFSFGNNLTSTTQMAFWLRPGDQDAPGECGNLTPAIAVNTSILSNVKLTKQVNIGFNGIPNVIQYLVSFDTSLDSLSLVNPPAQFETLTGYMPQNFSSFYTYNPTTKALIGISATNAEQSFPLIFSDPTGSHVMGIYTPDLPRPTSGYGNWNFGSVVKWNSVYRLTSAPPGHYNFQNYVVIGTFSQVVQGMTSLMQYFHPTGTTTLTAVNRFSKDTGGHFFTTDLIEGLNAGFKPEGIGFNVYPTNTGISNAMPVYRCRIASTGMHFVSASSTCEGAITEGLYGYGQAAPNSSNTPLLRYYNTVTHDYLATTSAEGNVISMPPSNWILDGTIAYVPLAN